ncbi:hypothetical protein E4U60_001591 [Claviceps pazoutovae]|uniref:Uncharacterized protein n=1 Tax=Claviceps pazoutovae TaxID=1649127 RepID=A0A9P7MCF8_9HYPO|nr:hypothetical protein E4U60_001591 [Claviceps pazoutovae]
MYSAVGGEATFAADRNAREASTFEQSQAMLRMKPESRKPMPDSVHDFQGSTTAVLSKQLQDQPASQIDAIENEDEVCGQAQAARWS